MKKSHLLLLGWSVLYRCSTLWIGEFRYIHKTAEKDFTIRTALMIPTYNRIAMTRL